jgi:hypothetical protein
MTKKLDQNDVQSLIESLKRQCVSAYRHDTIFQQLVEKIPWEKNIKSMGVLQLKLTKQLPAPDIINEIDISKKPNYLNFKKEKTNV